MGFSAERRRGLRRILEDGVPYWLFRVMVIDTHNLPCRFCKKVSESVLRSSKLTKIEFICIDCGNHIAQIFGRTLHLIGRDGLYHPVVDCADCGGTGQTVDFQLAKQCDACFGSGKRPNDS